MFENYTPQSIWNQIVSELDTDLATNEGSFLYDIFAPALVEIWKVYLSMNALESMFYIDETSGPYIDKMAGVFGMERKAGTKAVCSISFIGVNETIVPAGASFLTADGLSYLLDEDVTIVDGHGAGTLTASEIGAKYNVAAGDIIKSQVSHYGITSFANAGAVGGTDQESDAALVSRFYAFLRKPAVSGNCYHYQLWSMEVPGVGAARVVGLWNGPGTVKVIMLDPNMRPVDDAVLSAAESHIAEERPLGATVTCVSASVISISVAAVVTLTDDISLEAVNAEFTQVLSDYITSLTAEKFPIVLNRDFDDVSTAGLTISYNKIAALLIDCEGVLDFEDLFVNGAMRNVTMDIDEIPILGEVNLT